MNAEKYIAPVVMLAMLSGCATYPIASNIRDQAKPLTLSAVRTDPDGTRGTTVIWAGRIIDTVNDTNGGTIYIMQLPMRENEKPLAYGATTGRFVATSTEFLDPEAFPHGRLITVAGQVDGVRTERLQNMQYAYPVLDIKQTRVWPIKSSEYYYYYGSPGWYWGPDWGWYGGFYYPYYPEYYGGYHGGYHAGHEEHSGH